MFKTLIGIMIWIVGLTLTINVITSNDNAIRKIDLSGINSPIVTPGYDTHLKPTHTCDVGMFLSLPYDQVQVGLSNNLVTYQGQYHDVWYQAQEGKSVALGQTQRVSGVNLEDKTLTVDYGKSIRQVFLFAIFFLVIFGVIGAVVIFSHD